MSVTFSIRNLVAAALFGLAAATLPSGGPRAADADAAALLFEGEHFRAAPVGTTLRYEYRRTTRDPARAGASFSDTVDLKLDASDAPERRFVAVTLFRGAQHRAAGPFEGVSFNPVVMLMLEYHLGDFAKSLGGNPRYFKNAIRAALRDRATIEPVKITVGGREADASRVTVKPFEKDPQAVRFGVFIGTTYQFTVSDAVPGTVQEIRIVTPDPTGGAPVLEEVTRHVPN